MFSKNIQLLKKLYELQMQSQWALKKLMVSKDFGFQSHGIWQMMSQLSVSDCVLFCKIIMNSHSNASLMETNRKGYESMWIDE